MNRVVNIVFIKFISKICNEKNINIRQFFFLKFDNVNMRVYYFYNITFDKIAQKFFEFQLKHFNYQVETIDDINV